MAKAIVIGASSGIGRELALQLSQNGYQVGITGRRTALLEELKAEVPDSFAVGVFDCTEENTLGHLGKLVTYLGGMDLLVFSSGTGDLNPPLDHKIEQATNELNVTAFTKIATWGFTFFKQQGHGHLVAISSIGGLRGSALAPAYNASKAYQINYLEGLRQKAKKEGLQIAITDIRPGFVDTDMAKGEGQFWVASPQKAAKQIYQHIRQKSEVAYITKRWRIIAILLKILPTWVYKRM